MKQIKPSVFDDKIDGMAIEKRYWDFNLNNFKYRIANVNSGQRSETPVSKTIILIYPLK